MINPFDEVPTQSSAPISPEAAVQVAKPVRNESADLAKKLAAELAAVNRSQAVIEFTLDGTIQIGRAHV